MRHGVRDQQRSRVYSFGWAVGVGIKTDYSLPECQELVNKVSAAYNIRPPRVSDGRRRRIACYDSWSHEIKLPRWARNTKTILHECAHAIAKGDQHGPVFMRVFIDLLVRYGGCNRAEITKAARAERIRIAPSTKAPKAIAPRKLSRVQKINARIKELEREIGALEFERSRLLEGPRPLRPLIAADERGPNELRKLLSL